MDNIPHFLKVRHQEQFSRDAWVPDFPQGRCGLELHLLKTRLSPGLCLPTCGSLLGPRAPKPQFLPCGLLLSHLGVFMTWQLASPRVGDLRDSTEKPPGLYAETSEMTYHHFCCDLLATQTHLEKIRDGEATNA